MNTVVGNPDAYGNIHQGEKAFRTGLRDKEAVLRFHLKWNRGSAADHHFKSGYCKAAEAAGEPVGDALSYMPIWRGSLPLAEQVRILEIICEEQGRANGGKPAGAQWQLDRARAALAETAKP